MTIHQPTHFTSTARQGLSVARHEAAAETSPTIDMRHLLMGLAQLPVNESTAAHVLSGLGVTTEKLKALRPSGGGHSPQTDLSEDTRHALEHAAASAQRRGDQTIASAHLLAGALRENATLEILEQVGVTKERITMALSSLPIWTQEP